MSTLTSSISESRKSADFTDVTLVTKDEKFFTAHKLILASASDFFKNIFQTLVQNNSYLYLSNINSSEMQHVLDFIYLGEVQIPQSCVQDFLAISNLLKMNGSGPLKDPSNITNQDRPSLKKDPSEEFLDMDEYLGMAYGDDTENTNETVKLQEQDSISHKPNGMIWHGKKSKSITNAITEDLAEKIKSLIRSTGQAWECTLCGKNSSYLSNIKMHVEVHIEGLTFDCKICPETFKTRHSYSKHNAVHRLKYE